MSYGSSLVLGSCSCTQNPSHWTRTLHATHTGCPRNTRTGWETTLIAPFPSVLPSEYKFWHHLSLTLQKNNLKKTYLTVNPNAIIIVSPLIWRKRNSDSEGQARNESVFLEDKRAVVAAYYTCVPSGPATRKVTVQREPHGEQATGRAYRFHILDLKVFGLRG